MTTRTENTVVTGLGVVAPNGLGTEEFWTATLKGISGIDRISRYDPSGYPSPLAGEVLDFNASDHLSNRMLPQTDRMTQMALAASDWALADAGVDPAAMPEFDMGVVTASASGGFEFAQNELQKLWSKGPEYVSAYQSFAWFYAVNTGQISIRHGMRGPSGVLVTDQAGGLDALAHGRRHIRKGTGLVVSGGVDASLSPWGLVSQMTTGRLTRVTDPERAYAPFDVSADGHVPGEGGALVVLESETRARERGARSYGTIAGYGATFDPAPDTGREPGLRRAVELALADAAAAPSDIDVVFADAAGVRDLDRAEAHALAAVFGPEAVPVTAPKTMTGRLYSGAASLDVATALLAMRDGIVPPTLHVPERADDCPVDLVRDTAREMTVRTALVVARGHGGFNAALVLRAPDTH
ncbi:ketosynthase chain-length factor [Streptomyces sp. ISL-98]|uniref:ketosynthase chain-length factor n=1 Tax=Streptomyces sp. ISL-98 TaxID=2819192 RepID=UPI00090BE18A|nr:ketosynthase chain-length factor [Streptomyces sp. ISL-98]APD71738.1 type II polyketide synthase 2 [Streptomyces sp.]MBT2510558.1 ketosynthase chain-length factor [Streptomyces sp. ISL-98]